MKKILFIDRDGVVIKEPPDRQIDSFEKLEFYPFVFSVLHKISSEFNYELVMVSNQDGLGTQSFPEETFWPVQNFIIQSLANEGVCFKDILIDHSFAKDKAPTRKPGTAMVAAYMNNPEYDLKNSFVIGDRITDMQFAKNIGCKGIWVNQPAEHVLLELKDSVEEIKNAVVVLETNDWLDVFLFLKLPPRRIVHQRNNNETKITIDVNLDGTGKASMNTGLGFFDHMLEQIARHGNIDLSVECKGDLHIDEHHTIEDTGIALGEAIVKALGDKKGIERYAFVLPMDECLAQVAIDFGGRNWIVWDAEFKREKIGEMPTEMFFHFFKSFSDAAKCNLNIKVEGDNEHHKIESIFKAFAKCIKQAVKRDINNDSLPSTKGVL